MFSQWGKSDSYVQRVCWKTFGCMIYKTTSDKFCVGSSQIFFVLPCGLFLPQTIKYCHQRLIKIWLFEFGFPATRQIFIKIRLRILNQLSGSGNSIWGGVGGGNSYKVVLLHMIWIQIRICTWSWNRRPFISLPQLPHFVPLWDLLSLARGGRSYLEKKQNKQHSPLDGIIPENRVSQETFSWFSATWMWFLKFQIAQANLWNGFTWCQIKKDAYMPVSFLYEVKMACIPWPDLS